jgi:hypothetical protein
MTNWQLTYNLEYFLDQMPRLPAIFTSAKTSSHYLRAATKLNFIA